MRKHAPISLIAMFIGVIHYSFGVIWYMFLSIGKHATLNDYNILALFGLSASIVYYVDIYTVMFCIWLRKQQLEGDSDKI